MFLHVDHPRTGHLHGAVSGVVLDASDICRRDLRDPFSKPGISVDQPKENGNTAKGYLV